MRFTRSIAPLWLVLGLVLVLLAGCPNALNAPTDGGSDEPVAEATDPTDEQVGSRRGVGDDRFIRGLVDP